jgi:hypothetical protein
MCGQRRSGIEAGSERTEHRVAQGTTSKTEFGFGPARRSQLEPPRGGAITPQGRIAAWQGGSTGDDREGARDATFRSRGADVGL